MKNIVKIRLVGILGIFLCICGCYTQHYGQYSAISGHALDFIKIGDYACGEFQGGIIISRYFGENKEIVIPEKIKNKLVIGIEPSAFKKKGLTKVVIPDGVKYIGLSAFANNQLTSITIPNSLTSIIGSGNVGIPDEYGLFENNKLTSVAIPNSVTSIGNRAFANNQLTSVTIPNSVTYIGVRTFYNNQLTSVTIPNSVTAIEHSAFAKNQLTNVTIPNSVTAIGSYAFYDNQLTSVTIQNSVTAIGNYAFRKNPLEKVTIMASVRSDNVGWACLGSLTPAFIMNGCRPGTYTKQGLWGWALNGELLKGYAGIASDGKGVIIVKIDDNDPELYKKGNHYYVPTGEHTVEVKYDKTDGNRYVWSEGSVTFKQTYLFENTNYVYTSTMDDKTIYFKIVPE